MAGASSGRGASAARPARVLRDYAPADAAQVLDLAAGDALACRPRPRPEDLCAALASSGPVQGERMIRRVLVAVEAGRIVGTVSWLDDPDGGERFLLWLHAREQPAVVGALLDAAIEPRSRTVLAFALPTPLHPAPSGLPVRHRRVTHAALLAAGFVAQDRWLLLAGRPPPSAMRIADVRAEPADRRWLLSVTAADQHVAEMRVRLDRDGTGEVQWIGVAPACRGRGLGGRLLAQGLRLLGEAGARTILLAVEADNPAREPALRMYRAAGFEQVDELWSYRLEAAAAAGAGAGTGRVERPPARRATRAVSRP